jgi:hypothetical protein
LRVFKTKEFARYAKRAAIDDQTLCEAIQRAERGLIAADLGGGVIKQRISRDGEGRKADRTVIAYRSHKRAVFLYGFAKNERDNIKDDELASLKEMAAAWLNADDQKIKRSLAGGLLHEVKYDQKA